MAQEALITDYFYGDESEQFSYFRIPRLLITSPRFKGLSTDAKLLYGIKKAPKEGFSRSLSAVAAVWTAMQPRILHKPQRCRRRLKAFASA